MNCVQCERIGVDVEATVHWEWESRMGDEVQLCAAWMCRECVLHCHIGLAAQMLGLYDVWAYPAGDEWDEMPGVLRWLPIKLVAAYLPPRQASDIADTLRHRQIWQRPRQQFSFSESPSSASTRQSGRVASWLRRDNWRDRREHRKNRPPKQASLL